MAKFNKEFTHKGYTFNISVSLNETVERKPNGRVFHLLITNCKDALNYYQKERVDKDLLHFKIFEHERLAKEYIDKLITNDYRNEEEQSLLKLGFTEQV